MKKLIYILCLLSAGYLKAADVVLGRLDDQKYYSPSAGLSIAEYLFRVDTTGLMFWHSMEATNSTSPQMVVTYGATNWNGVYYGSTPTTVSSGNNKYGRAENILNLTGGSSGPYVRPAQNYNVTGLTALTYCYWMKKRAMVDYSDLMIRAASAGTSPNSAMAACESAGTGLFRVDLVNDSGTTIFGSYFYTTDAHTQLPTNEWHHIVSTWSKDQDSGYSRLYVDGKQREKYSAGNGCATALPAISDYQIGIGGDLTSAGRRFNGWMDNVMIFTNRCLTSNEVYSMYLNTHPTNNLITRNL